MTTEPFTSNETSGSNATSGSNQTPSSTNRPALSLINKISILGSLIVIAGASWTIKLATADDPEITPLKNKIYTKLHELDDTGNTGAAAARAVSLFGQKTDYDVSGQRTAQVSRSFENVSGKWIEHDQTNGVISIDAAIAAVERFPVKIYQLTPGDRDKLRELDRSLSAAAQNGLHQ